MTKLEQHNGRVNQDFIDKKALREKKILALQAKIQVLEKEIKKLQEINANGPKIASKDQNRSNGGTSSSTKRFEASKSTSTPST